MQSKVFKPEFDPECQALVASEGGVHYKGARQKILLFSITSDRFGTWPRPIPRSCYMKISFRTCAASGTSECASSPSSIPGQTGGEKEKLSRKWRSLTSRYRFPCGKDHLIKVGSAFLVLLQLRPLPVVIREELWQLQKAEYMGSLKLRHGNDLLAIDYLWDCDVHKRSMVDCYNRTNASSEVRYADRKERGQEMLRVLFVTPPKKS